MRGLNTVVAIYLRGRKTDRQFTRHLVSHFGRRAVKNITPRRIIWYQKARLKHGAAPTSINKEVQCLLRVLRTGGYTLTVRPLPDIPRERRVLTEADAARLAVLAAGRKRWQNALAFAVMSTTGLRPKQLRALTWSCVDPFAEVIRFGGSEYAFTPVIRETLIRLEQDRAKQPGRCRVADKVLPFRSCKDARRAMMRELG